MPSFIHDISNFITELAGNQTFICSRVCQIMEEVQLQVSLVRVWQESMKAFCKNQLALLTINNGEYCIFYYL